MNTWNDIIDAFSSYEEKLDIPPPDELLFYAYEHENYEGYALVIFRNGPLYYYVYGSHCSCYGLEGQFQPEQFNTKEVFLAFLKQLNDYHFEKEIAAVIAKLEGGK